MEERREKRDGESPLFPQELFPEFVIWTLLVYGLMGVPLEERKRTLEGEIKEGREGERNRAQGSYKDETQKTTKEQVETEDEEIRNKTGG